MFPTSFPALPLLFFSLHVLFVCVERFLSFFFHISFHHNLLPYCSGSFFFFSLSLCLYEHPLSCLLLSLCYYIPVFRLPSLVTWAFLHTIPTLLFFSLLPLTISLYFHVHEVQDYSILFTPRKCFITLVAGKKK